MDTIVLSVWYPQQVSGVPSSRVLTPVVLNCALSEALSEAHAPANRRAPLQESLTFVLQQAGDSVAPAFNHGCEWSQ